MDTPMPHKEEQRGQQAGQVHGEALIPHYRGPRCLLSHLS